MIELHPLSAVKLPRLRHIKPNPEAPEWEAEVERIILGPTGRSWVGAPRSWLLAADHAGAIVGAVLHYPHDALRGAQYLAGVLLDHRLRGEGLGHELVEAAIRDAIERSDRGYVAWMVHPENKVMLHLSAQLGEQLEVDQVTGYHQFAHP